MQTIKHQAWPDIGQFRNMIRAVKEKATFSHLDVNGDAVFDNCKPLPTLEFSATTKKHGTNAAIGVTVDGQVWFQSRERIVTLEDDNAGFARFWKDLESKFTIQDMVKHIPFTNEILVFGEWCGGSIQKGVALNQLPKMFVIFGVKVDGVWQTPDEVKQWKEYPEYSIYNTYSVELPTFTIDFNKPEIAQNEMVELVAKIEAECTWGKKFGVAGVGEGFVIRSITKGWEGTSFYAKLKGEKHSISKVKTIASVDIEKVASERAFCEMVVTDARCEQMIQKVKATGVKIVDRTQIGLFLKMLVGDIFKEESDVAIGNGLDIQKMGGMLSTYGKQWFFKNEDKFDEL